MNPNLDHLRQAVASVEAEMKLRNDYINRLTWELAQLAEQRSELLKAIAEQTIVRNPVSAT